MYEMASLFENIGTVRDGIRILSQSFTVKDKQGASPLDISSGEIIFENISFSYGSGKNVINNLNLKINNGERVGLVGPSGGGKTTTMNLLLRILFSMYIHLYFLFLKEYFLNGVMFEMGDGMFHILSIVENRPLRKICLIKDS